MNSIHIPVKIESSFLSLRQEHFQTLNLTENEEFVSMQIQKRSYQSIRIKPGKTNSLICIPSDHRLLSGTGKQILIAVEHKSAGIQIEVAVQLYQLRLVMNAVEYDWFQNQNNSESAVIILSQKRGLALMQPTIRVKPGASFSLRLDADLALSAGLTDMSRVAIYFEKKANQFNVFKPDNNLQVITENDIRRAFRFHKIIHLEKGQLITPAAKSLGRELKNLEE